MGVRDYARLLAVAVSMMCASIILLLPLGLMGCGSVECAPVGYTGWTDPAYCKEWRLEQQRRREFLL